MTITRDQIRLVLRHMGIIGELYRDYRLIRVEKGHWQVQGYCPRFVTRQEAREWVDRHTAEFDALILAHAETQKSQVA